MSIRATAAILGVSPSTIMRDIQKGDDYRPDDEGRIDVGTVMGLDGKRRPSRRFDTSARDEQICDLRYSGKSLRTIAAEVGCSVGTVHRVLAAHGF